MKLRGNRFRVCGRLDMASRPSYGTVVVERATADADLFHVRPLRRRRVYTLPLSTVAEIVVRQIIQQEVGTKRAEKAKRRQGR